jgi:hypothetical protein
MEMSSSRRGLSGTPAPWSALFPAAEDLSARILPVPSTFRILAPSRESACSRAAAVQAHGPDPAFTRTKVQPGGSSSNVTAWPGAAAANLDAAS